MSFYKRCCFSSVVFLVLLLLDCAAQRKLPQVSRYGERERLAYQHYINGDWYELSGDMDSALSEYQMALDYQPGNADILMASAEAYLKKGQFEDALTQTLEIEPKNSDVWIFSGDCYRHLGDVGKAIDAYTKAAELDSLKVDAYWYLANIYEKTEDLDKAVQNWKEITLILPFNDVARLHLASLYVKMGRHEEGIGQYQRILELNPANQDALLGLGEAYEDSKQYDMAIQQYDKILEEDYFNVELRRKLISIYLQAGHLDLAIKQAEIVSQLLPQDVPSKKSLALLHMANKSYVRAETLLSEIIQQNPNDPIAYIYAGRMALEQKQYSKADQSFRKAISIQDTIIEAWIGLASVCFDQDSIEKGMEIYQEALQKVNRKEDIYYLMGITCDRRKDFASGVKYLLKADSLKPGDIRIMFALASSCERNGQFDEATQLFRDILEIDPEDAMTLNYLGYMFADKDINLEESLRMIEKAVRLEPENGAYLDSYGWVLYRLKRYREAEEQVRRALERTNDDSTVYDHLGDICKAQGKLEEAGENWRKTLELDPQNERVKEKLKEQSQ